MKEVSTSILSKDDKFYNIKKLNNSNTDYIHLDIMDNTFVNNCFLSDDLDEVLSKITKKIDIHFMVNDPLKYLDIIKKYNISYVTVPYEIPNFLEKLNILKKYFKVGISINPETNEKEIFDYLDELSLVLVLGVNPGYSNQTFILNTKEKLNNLKQEITKRNLNTKLMVDGGVNDQVFSCIKAADIVVSASFVLSDLNNIDKIKKVD